MFFGSKLITQLNSRGYDSATIFRSFIEISKIERDKLIPYRNKDSRFNNNNLDDKIFFKLPFDCNLNANAIRLALNTSSNGFGDVKIQQINSMQDNFASVFVHNKPYNAQVEFCYKKCLFSKCIICKYSDTSLFIILNDFVLPILSNSSCISKNVVYILKCKYCCSYYIGQSENLHRRIKTHIRCCC